MKNTLFLFTLCCAVAGELPTISLSDKEARKILEAQRTVLQIQLQEAGLAREFQEQMQKLSVAEARAQTAYNQLMSSLTPPKECPSCKLDQTTLEWKPESK